MAAVADTTTDVVFSRHHGGSGGSGNGGNGKSSRNDAVFRRRCLKWLRLRLPLAWVLNQVLLGRVPGCGIGDDDSDVSVGSAAAVAAAAVASKGAEEEEAEEGKRCLGRGLTIPTVSEPWLAAAIVASGGR